MFSNGNTSIIFRIHMFYRTLYGISKYFTKVINMKAEDALTLKSKLKNIYMYIYIYVYQI